MTLHIIVLFFLVSILPVSGSDGKRIFACIREIRAHQLASANLMTGGAR
jgi:preprotein translocase subunit SecY